MLYLRVIGYCKTETTHDVLLKRVYLFTSNALCAHATHELLIICLDTLTVWMLYCAWMHDNNMQCVHSASHSLRHSIHWPPRNIFTNYVVVNIAGTTYEFIVVSFIIIVNNNIIFLFSCPPILLSQRYTYGVYCIRYTYIYMSMFVSQSGVVSVSRGGATGLATEGEHQRSAAARKLTNKWP